MIRLRTICAVPIAVALVFLAPAVNASEPSQTLIQDRIDEVIEKHGGEQTNWNEVTWDKGNIVLTIESNRTGNGGLRSTESSGTTSPQAICESGKFCLFGRSAYGGSKLTYSSCPATISSFDAIGGSVGSIKNNRASGTVKAYSGSSVMATVSAGQGNSSLTGITKVTCS